MTFGAPAALACLLSQCSWAIRAAHAGVVNDEEARELTRRELSSDSLVITDSKRINRTWVVYFNNRRYVETGDVLYFETGPGPILVSDSGRVMRAPGTTRPIRTSERKSLAESVAECEKRLF
jgi:hypothetical protein